MDGLNSILIMEPELPTEKHNITLHCVFSKTSLGLIVQNRLCPLDQWPPNTGQLKERTCHPNQFINVSLNWNKRYTRRCNLQFKEINLVLKFKSFCWCIFDYILHFASNLFPFVFFPVKFYISLNELFPFRFYIAFFGLWYVSVVWHGLYFFKCSLLSIVYV